MTEQQKATFGSKDECDKVVRGYFSLGEDVNVVHITSSVDFLLHIWARNVETFNGGIQVITPPSRFRPDSAIIG